MYGTYRVTQLANLANLVASTNSIPYVSDTSRVLAVHAIYTGATVSASVTLQCSLDGVTWADFTTATAYTAPGNTMWHVDTKDVLYWRVAYAHTSGTTSTLRVYVGNIAR